MSRVILVHGAWHGDWCWERVKPLLEATGLEVITVDLPSAGDGGDLAADATIVRAAITASDAPAVVVGHSYGGVVITEAAAGLPQVTHLVYLAAFMLDEGESLLAAVGGEAPPWFVIDEATGTVLPDDARAVFYHDVPDEHAGPATARIEPQSLAAFAAPLTVAAWHHIPSTYIACTDDRAIPYAAQQAMSQRATTVLTIDSSHSPYLSQPEVVANLIAGVA